MPKELLDRLQRSNLVNYGSLLLASVVLVTIIVWLVQFPASLAYPLRSLAKVSAFSAVALLSLNFLLSTRARSLERLFGGLDRMYAAHCTVGRATLVSMALHPLFLVLANAGESERLLDILLPGRVVDYTVGTVALFVFIALLALTIVYALPYRRWLSGHRFMGVVLLLSGYHALSSGSDIAAHPFLAWWTLGLVVLGLGAFTYASLLYPALGPRTVMKVAGTRVSEGAVDIWLEHDGNFTFLPGQFAYVKFEGTDGESHPFSISGWRRGGIRLSIKASGDMTSGLPGSISVGAKAIVRGPFGTFGEKHARSEGDVVWIAGGIGITPFLALLQAEATNPTGRRVLLIWSFRKHGELPYEEEILGTLTSVPHLTFVHWSSADRGRLTGEKVEELLLEENVKERRFLLCGPRPMMYGIGRQLMAMGVGAKDIAFEDFDLI